MTTKDIFAAIYSKLNAVLPTVVWSQARQDRPNAAVWGVITYDGEAPVNLALPGYQYVYFRVWIYSGSPDETDLMNMATDVKTALTRDYIASPSGKWVKLSHISTSPIYMADEYQVRATDLTFRATTNSL